MILQELQPAKHGVDEVDESFYYATKYYLARSIMVPCARLPPTQQQHFSTADVAIGHAREELCTQHLLASPVGRVFGLGQTLVVLSWTHLFY
jgi:hypothetical protein